jgi:isoquinoline 1-oxidoreductase beta subunit
VALCTHGATTSLCVITEVEVGASGDVRLRRAVAAVDCGTAVNPDIIVAQVQGGLIFGWTSALFSKITIRGGAVQQGNFNDYRLLRFNEAPPIEVHIVSSAEKPSGIGEPPAMVAAPTLANAIFDAVRVRVRDLPVDPRSLAIA